MTAIGRKQIVVEIAVDDWQHLQRQKDIIAGLKEIWPTLTVEQRAAFYMKPWFDVVTFRQITGIEVNVNSE